MKLLSTVSTSIKNVFLKMYIREKICSMTGKITNDRDRVLTTTLLNNTAKANVFTGNSVSANMKQIDTVMSLAHTLCEVAIRARQFMSVQQMCGPIGVISATNSTLDMTDVAIEADTMTFNANYYMSPAEIAERTRIHDIDWEHEVHSALQQEIRHETVTELFDAIRGVNVKNIDTSSVADAITYELSLSKMKLPTFMICSPSVLTKIICQNNEGFTPSNQHIIHDVDGRLQPVGMLGENNVRLLVFVDPYETNHTCVIGCDGMADEETGVVYSPYVPCIMDIVENGLRLKTLHAITIADNAKNYYATLSFTDEMMKF